jgi:hypothetical protein
MHNLLTRHALSVHYSVLPEAANNTAPAQHWVGLGRDFHSPRCSWWIAVLLKHPALSCKMGCISLSIIKEFQRQLNVAPTGFFDRFYHI